MRKTWFGLMGVVCVTSAACSHPAVKTAPSTATAKAGPPAAAHPGEYVIDGGTTARPEIQNSLYVIDGVLLTEAPSTANHAGGAAGAKDAPGYFIYGVPLTKPPSTGNRAEGGGGVQDSPLYVIDGVPLDVPGGAGAAHKSTPATPTPQR